VRVISIGILSALIAFAGPDSAAPAPRSAAAPALSIGSPNEGRLDGGARLTETPYLRVVPYYAESNARWGLPSLVGLLDRSARRVARKFPDAVMSVGDLSRRGGGELDRHHSHESGRDADIGFYIRNAKRPILPVKFVAFSAAGAAPTMPGAIFDDARNWALIEALIDDPTTRVSYIFVVAHVRARLLRYAEKMGVPRALRERAAEVMMQPRRAAHDDHFHIRIACPREQHGTCVEQAIVYAPRTRPPVPRARHRSGTDDRGKPLPVLPVPPKGVGAVASFADPAKELEIADTTDVTARS
jgi:penicillin-insensitive murein endopeptidase